MTEQTVILTDDEILDFGNSLRHDLVVNLTTNKSGLRELPTDTDTIGAIRGLLKDSDSSVYTKRRVMTEELSAENDKRAAELLELVLDKTPHARRCSVDSPKNGTGPVFDPKQLPEFEIEAGAVSAVGDTVDLDQINRTGRQVRKGLELED